MTIKPAATVRVRRAVEKDIPALQGLLCELHALHYDAMPERFLPQAVGEIDPGVFRGRLDDSAQCLFVAEMSGHVAGYARAEVRSPPDGIAHRGRTFVEVHEIVVAEGQQGGGAGRLLMEEIADWAKERNVSSLELSVYAFNAQALAFYRRLGMVDLRITLTGPVGADAQ